MDQLSHTGLFFFFATQVVGLCSAAAARISLGLPCQKPAQWLFFVFLPVVGIVVVISLGLGPGCWLTSGTTFSLMVLTVTCDFNPQRRAMAP